MWRGWEWSVKDLLDEQSHGLGGDLARLPQGHDAAKDGQDVPQETDRGRLRLPCDSGGDQVRKLLVLLLETLEDLIERLPVV